MYYERNDSGYTRGGLDVVTGINLFFKGILIFPILVLAAYLGLAMVKHMIYSGIPNMELPNQQQETSVLPELPQLPSLPEVEEERTWGEVPAIPVLPSPESYSSVSNCQYSPVCPPGGEHRVGANGLPYVWPTAVPLGGW